MVAVGRSVGQACAMSVVTHFFIVANDSVKKSSLDATTLTLVLMEPRLNELRLNKVGRGLYSDSEALHRRSIAVYRGFRA